MTSAGGEPNGKKPHEAKTPGRLLYVCTLSTSHFWDGSPKAQSLFFPTPFPTEHSSEKSVLLQSLWRYSTPGCTETYDVVRK